MNLSAEQLASILANAANQQPSRGAEHRRAPRVPLSARITLLSATERKGPASMVTVKDVSCRGIGFLMPQPLASGQQLVVCFPRDATTPLALLCTVMHSRPLSRDLFAVGAEFASEIDLDQQSANQTEDWVERERIKASILL